jgi:phosphoadenosine phosphosulfate reductase
VLCINGKDKILLSPIIDWTNSDVWNFIRNHKLEYCELYDQGYTRIGCMFCPNCTVKSKQRDRRNYPRVEKKIKESIIELMAMGKYADFENADEVFNWWISNISQAKYKGMKQNYTIDYE